MRKLISLIGYGICITHYRMKPYYSLNDLFINRIIQDFIIILLNIYYSYDAMLIIVSNLSCVGVGINEGNTEKESSLRDH